MSKELTISFGPLNGTISAQLKQQKFLYNKKTIKGFEEIRTHYLHLRIRGYLSDAQGKKITKKLFKQILAHISKLNKR